MALGQPFIAMSTNRRICAALACGLTLLLAACGGSGLATNGPLGPPTNHVGECGPASRGGVLTNGITTFGDHGGDATVERVTLEDPHHLRMVDGWIVPLNGTSLVVGAASGYPPGPFPPSPAWPHRERIPGAVVSHTKAGDNIELVMVVQKTGRTGTATGFNIFYKSAGTQYLLRMPVSTTVLTGDC